MIRKHWAVPFVRGRRIVFENKAKQHAAYCQRVFQVSRREEPGGFCG